MINPVMLSSPISVELTLTKNCNHKCLHCYNPWRKDWNTKTEKDISSLTFEEKSDIICNQIVQNNIWKVIITGGEPLVDKKKLYYILNKLSELDVFIGINTNLTLIDRDFAHFLRYELPVTPTLFVSLPSCIAHHCNQITQIEDSYQNIVEGIELCEEFQIPIGINMVVSKININDTLLLSEFIKRYNNINYVALSPCVPPVHDKNNLDYYLSNEDIIMIADSLLELQAECHVNVGSVIPLPLCILKDLNKYNSIVSTSCCAGLSHCGVDIMTGDVTACPQSNTCSGNIFQEGLKVAWENMNEWRDDTYLNQHCVSCKYLSICGGECKYYGSENLCSSYNLDSDCTLKFPYIPTLPVFNRKQKYMLSPNLRIRTEKFGAVVFNNGEFYQVGIATREFINYIGCYDSFTIDEISHKILVDDNFFRSFSFLVSTGILREI